MWLQAGYNKLTQFKAVQLTLTNFKMDLKMVVADQTVKDRFEHVIEVVQYIMSQNIIMAMKESIGHYKNSLSWLCRGCAQSW